MRIGQVALTLSAATALLVGGVYPSVSQAPFPLRLFEQAKPEDYAGDEACAECHEDQVAQFPLSAHATFMKDPKLPLNKQGCEACHGPGTFHVREENPEVIGYTKMTAKEVSLACLRCHGGTMKLSHWHQTDHARANVSCVSCHQIHPKADPTSPKGDRGVSKRQVFPAVKTSGRLLKADEATLCGTCHAAEVGQFRMNSHHPIPEGRMVCSDCHEPHPTKAGVKRVGFVKETCVSCHPEAAGPFAFEHDPVAGWTGDGCGECHRAHGTQTPKLLRASSRGLCSQCHTEKATAHYPGRTCWSAGCHVAPHGSNTSRRLLSR